MTGSDLINMLKEHEDREIVFNIGFLKDNTDYGATLVHVKDIIIEDVSPSEKMVMLGYSDKLEGTLEYKY